MHRTCLQWFAGLDRVDGLGTAEWRETMSLIAVVLVLGSAVVHACWNLLAKQSGGGAPFIWLASLVSVLLWWPAAIVALVCNDERLAVQAVGAVLLSGTLHLIYFLLLQGGYRAGDLSLVYPLARGSAPVLATVGAWVLLDERPEIVTIVGVALVVVGVVALTIGPAQTTGSVWLAVVMALATGVTIATYTVVDKWAVSDQNVPPVLQYWGSTVVVTAALSPAVARRRADVVRHWRDHRRAVVGVGVLSPLAYILVLTALEFSKVSVIAAAREISVPLGAAMGARLLAERFGPRRIVAAIGIAAGVVVLALT